MKEVERRKVGENENKSRGQEKWRGEEVDNRGRGEEDRVKSGEA